MAGKPKLCVDCKWFAQGKYEWCEHPRFIDRVTGKKGAADARSCRYGNVDISSDCGIEGKYWEAK